MADTLRYGETARQFYTLHAWVIMPNHIHVILEPRIALADILRCFKGRSGRVANRLVGRYVEGNPVQPKLVEAEYQWPW